MQEENLVPLGSWQVRFMALCTGLMVANIYYCQPLVVLVSREFGVAESKAGTITFCTQLGYTLGLLFLVPLGDKLERRGHIVATTGLAVLALAGAALSTSLISLQVASFLIGATCIVPQLILPLAAHLSLPNRRGKVIGTVMSGLLIGILLSRTVSGVVGAWLGWRSMFWIAAGITTFLLILMYRTFPVSRTRYSGNYAALLRSLVTLFRQQPLLREASVINALAFASFGLFWTTMVLHLSAPPFRFHSDTIGLFGLAAAAGALIAPIIGGKADRGNPRVAIGYGIFILAVSFLIFGLFPASITAMIVGIILLDLALQAVHVSNQTRVYTLIPEARNRINTVYMTISFLGTSLGSAIGLWVWDTGGWIPVCITGGCFTALAFVVYGRTYRRSKN